MKQNIFKIVRELEIAGVKRAAILEVVKPELEKIDGARKTLKESLSKEIKALDCVSAVKVCNMISRTKQGADSAETTKLNKRRNTLKGILSQSFPEYDFENVTTRAGGVTDCKIQETKVGDKETRQAIILLEALKMVKAHGFNTLDVTREALVTALKDGLETVVVEKDIEDTGESVQDILARIKSGLTADDKEVQEAQEAQA